MARSQTFAAIDVGTTKVCALVGEVREEGDIHILGFGIAPTLGLRRGIVVDIDEATIAIRAAVDAAERTSGYRIVSAHLSITGAHIASLNNRGVVAISRPDRLITADDVTRVLEAARTVSVPSNREILHVIPRSYIMDGQEGVTNPIGMHGFRLDVEAHIITAATASVQNLVKCVQSLGVTVDDLVFKPIAASEAVLSPQERAMGVVLADIGGGTTDIATFIDGSIWHTASITVSGYHLTNDVAIGLRTPFAAAEELKVRYGSVNPEAVEPEATVAVPAFGSDTTREVLRRQLCEILRLRAEEILKLIQLEIKRSGYEGLLPAGLVITGGSANLPGLEQLAAETLGLPARIGRPHHIHGLSDAIDNPAFATSVGLLLWGPRHAVFESRPRRRPAGPNIFKRLAVWARELLPQ